MPPKRVPIVDTSRCRSAVTAEARQTAISIPGQVGRNVRKTRMVATVRAATAAADGLSVGRASISTGTLSTSAPGSLTASLKPSNSLIWLAKMITAMPAVNPTVTG
jgi:hypothetical protein